MLAATMSTSTSISTGQPYLCWTCAANVVANASPPNWTESAPSTSTAMPPPIAPSHDLPGEIDGASLCLPNALPEK